MPKILISKKPRPMLRITEVNNLEIKDLFFSFDDVCKFDIKNLGLYYESLFVSSLAAKYYLRSITAHKDDYIPFHKSPITTGFSKVPISDDCCVYI